MFWERTLIQTPHFKSYTGWQSLGMLPSLGMAPEERGCLHFIVKLTLESLPQFSILIYGSLYIAESYPPLLLKHSTLAMTALNYEVVSKIRTNVHSRTPCSCGEVNLSLQRHNDQRLGRCSCLAYHMSSVIRQLMWQWKSPSLVLCHASIFLPSPPP